MNSVIEQVILEYDWDRKYAKSVAFEYMRFLDLRHEDPDLSPSDDIDRFWHQHILNTKSYFTYCFKKYAQIVHHNPADAYDQKARAVRLKNTIAAYIEKFGPIKSKKIWASGKESTKKVVDYYSDSDEEILAKKPSGKACGAKKHSDGRKC